MDTESLSRRERRHYRKFVDGKVVYTTDNNLGFNSSSKESVRSSVSNNDMNLTGGSLLDLSKKSNEVNIDKQKVIGNILGQLNEMITPDVDEISEVIYSQLKNENVHVEKEIIKDAVQNSKHYRSSKKTSNKPNTKYDSKNLESVVKDVYNQIEKEHIKKENKDKKAEVADLKSSTKNTTKSKNKQKSSKASSSKVKNGKSTIKKPKTDFKDLLDDDSDDDISNLDSDDDLGLKF